MSIKKRISLPAHAKKHHKPFRWRYIALFFAGLALGVALSYRTGYLVPREYDVNTASPAAVKVYHFVCGKLIVNNQPQTKDFCDAGVGSGFFISGDGYIATSGHVVTKDAADILVSHMRQDPSLLQQYALSKGVDESQLIDYRVTADLLASVYDSSPRELRLENRRDLTLVALGDRPLQINTQEDIRALFNKPDTDYVKRVKTVGVDFSAKDLLVIEQQADRGFSARDVALLKVDLENTPIIPLADTSMVHQGDPVTLIGFPSDADNQLTKNDQISPSITTGSINAIRSTNGTESILYQSDADASQGSSGGPAVNTDGEAIGIVTYRYKDSAEASAAKSYIRDINDLKTLLKAKLIQLSTVSGSQTAWDQGLEAMQQHRYSEAIKQFRTAALYYPAHRLAGTYIQQSQQLIKSGKEVKDPPYVLIGVAVVAGLLMGVAISLSVRHHRAHRRYKAAHNRNRDIITPS